MKDFNIKRCILRSIIIALAVIIAELVPQFDMVMGIIGGTLTGPMIFILPPLFYRRLIQMERDFDEQNERETFNQLTIANSDDDIFKEHDFQHRHDDSYGTFAKTPKQYTARSDFRLCFCTDSFACDSFACDSLICVSVIIFGLIVTITSTYFNLMTVSSNFDDFRSPCIQNITASFGEL